MQLATIKISFFHTSLMAYGLWLMAYGLWLMAYGLWQKYFYKLKRDALNHRWHNLKWISLSTYLISYLFTWIWSQKSLGLG
jgi:hypothetical protein